MVQTIAAALRALAAYPIYLGREIAEGALTVSRYYRNPCFRRADLLCLRAYLGRDPHAICHRFLRRHADHRVQKIYGETFFSTLETIARAVELCERDVVYEIGCGRGRGVFWLNAMYSCRVVGIEINPEFVSRARAVCRKAGMKGVDFVLANALDVDYGEATVVYLYGTAFPREAIVALVARFAALRPGTRIVSVSYPLSDFAEPGEFETDQVIAGRFLWGTTNIYVQRKL